MGEDVAPNRRQQILEVLARELEDTPGARVTTARLAAAVGVSEAALYRHFPSKARMFEDLIQFAEEAVFGLLNRILTEERDPQLRCERIMLVLLGFAERNPGITRVLLGDALVGENERLRGRVAQFFNRVETQLKQVLREGEATSGHPCPVSVAAAAALLLALAEGKMTQFARSRFQRSPLQDWREQWGLVSRALFEGTVAG